MSNRSENSLFWLGTFAGVALYLWLASAQLTLPGIQYDETMQATPAVPLATGVLEGDYAITWRMKLGWRWIPIMNMEYMGALESWLLAVGFKLFGVKVEVLRGFNLLCAAAGLWLAAIWARRWWGASVAVAGLWLLATDASFIWLTRQNQGPVALAFFLRMLTLWALVRWWQSAGDHRQFGHRWFWLACGVAGLGLFDKVNFLWFIVAAIPVGWACWWQVRERLPLDWRKAMIGVGIGFLTSLPLWIFNFTTGFLTFRMAQLPGEKTTLSGLWALAPARLETLSQMLTGRDLTLYWVGRPLPELPLGKYGWGWTLTIIAVIGLLLFTFTEYRLNWRRWTWLTMPTMTLLILLQIFLIPRPVWVHHWIGIYPFPQLMIALFFVVVLGRAVREPRLLTWFGSLVIAASVFVNLTMQSGYQQLLTETGGTQGWSDAIYALSDRLQSDYADRDIQLLDWGIGHQLLFLSGGKLRTREPFWAQMNDIVPQPALLAAIRDRKNVFVAHTMPQMFFPKTRQALDAAAQQTGLHVKVHHVFNERSGKPLFEIITLEP